MCIIFFPVDAKAMLKTKGVGGGVQEGGKAG